MFLCPKAAAYIFSLQTSSMFLRENLYVIILCVTAIISSCVALTVWVRREVTLSIRPFIWLMLAIAAYAATAAGSEVSNSAGTLTFWTTLEYIASNSTIALYLTFALHFTGFKSWLSHRRRFAIWALPVFNMALVLSNHWHHLVWTGITLYPTNSHLNIIHHGAGYYWIAACFYIYVFTGSAFVTRSGIRSSHLHRRQAITIVVGSLPPLIAGTLFTLGISPENANILPMSFLLTGLIYFASLFSFRLFDLLPIARDRLIEQMNDGVLVIDRENRVIDMNPAARKYAYRPKSICTGQKLARVLNDWEEIVHHCYHADDFTSHVVAKPSIPCYIEVRITYLHDHEQRFIGKLLVLRDITQQHQNQLKIQQANTDLTLKLEQIQRLQSQLKEQAIRDGLTGLFNRRYFEETIPAERTKAERAGTSLCIVLMDIDHFKKVNDTYGHIAGDEALRAFSGLVHKHIRGSDIACRYGGEEFILAMPDMPLTEAYQRAENIRRAVKEMVINCDGVTFQVTVSMGLGAFPDFPGSQKELLTRVDQALYVAKANGRDRIEVANEKTAIISKLNELENAIATSRSSISRSKKTFV
ncbi:MAG: diguanylate cyclase [Cyanobacteria bacterium J06598_1]